MSAAVSVRHAYARELKAKASPNSTEPNVAGPVSFSSISLLLFFLNTEPPLDMQISLVYS